MRAKHPKLPPTANPEQAGTFRVVLEVSCQSPGGHCRFAICRTVMRTYELACPQSPARATFSTGVDHIWCTRSQLGIVSQEPVWTSLRRSASRPLGRRSMVIRNDAIESMRYAESFTRDDGALSNKRTLRLGSPTALKDIRDPMSGSGTTSSISILRPRPMILSMPTRKVKLMWLFRRQFAHSVGAVGWRCCRNLTPSPTLSPLIG